MNLSPETAPHILLENKTPSRDKGLNWRMFITPGENRIKTFWQKPFNILSRRRVRWMYRDKVYICSRVPLLIFISALINSISSARRPTESV
jgi:hypothetical protein